MPIEFIKCSVCEYAVMVNDTEIAAIYMEGLGEVMDGEFVVDFFHKNRGFFPEWVIKAIYDKMHELNNQLKSEVIQPAIRKIDLDD